MKTNISMNPLSRSKKVAVGMSGGVDSSVTALLLKNEGHEVVGITMLLRPSFEDGNKEALDAKAVCDKIGIKHYVCDFRPDFTKNVIENFISEYKSGRTPNPCIECNFTMKFGKMLDFAIDLGCDYIATGHYAKIEKIDNQFYLRKSDSIKDQSYFLYRMNQFQLSHTIFPLIHMTKDETREIASKYDLPVAQKSDSQDICFIKDGDYISFLENNFSGFNSEGNFVDINGKILGKHKGIHRYTVGQRKGLGIALGERKFVCSLNSENNTVCLGGASDCETNSIVISNPHYINFDSLNEEIEVEVKTRFRAKPQKAKLIPMDNAVEIIFDEVQNFISPGQSAVFYKDGFVLGGGIIT